MESQKVCAGSDTLIFACSGAADVGALADQSARAMTRQGIGQMFCLAGVAGGVKPILEKTAAAKKILAIDGCGMSCVKCCLEKAGFTEFSHLQLGTLGMTKGQTPPTEETINKVVAQGKAILA